MARKFTVRSNCEYTVTVEAESAEQAIKFAEEQGFPDHHDQAAWAPAEAEAEAGDCESCGDPLPDPDDAGESRCAGCGALHS